LTSCKAPAHPAGAFSWDAFFRSGACAFPRLRVLSAGNANGGRAIPDLETPERGRNLLAARYRPLRLLAVIASIFLWTPFTGGFVAWPTEQGSVEWHSLVILILCAPAFLLVFPPRLWPRFVHVPVGALLLARREGEAEWWIIDERLLGPAFYVEQGPTPTALAGGAIALMVLASVGTLLVFGLPALWRAMRARRAWAVLLGLAAALAVAGQVVEEVGMAPLAALIGPWAAAVSEEACELLFAILVFEAILAAAPRRTDRAGPGR
jgi:hypothetical protein